MISHHTYKYIFILTFCIVCFCLVIVIVITDFQYILLVITKQNCCYWYVSKQFYKFRPKVALTAIRKKMNNSNPHIALYALLVRYLYNIYTYMYTIVIYCYISFFSQRERERENNLLFICFFRY